MDDRLALRLGALRLARRRGRTRDAAWAAARLRLFRVTLEPVDARFARDVRVKLGRALRLARIRRQPAAPNVTLPLLGVERRSRRRQLIAAAIAAVLLLGALLFFIRLQEPAGSPEGASPAVAVAAPLPSPLRGRTQPGLAVPVTVAEATPPPPEAVVTTAPGGSGTGAVGGGTGAGGSGGGTSSGNGRGTPPPTPKPSPTPTPTPDPSTVVHVTGRVVDAATLQGLPGVCISIGHIDCSLSPQTQADGSFDVVLPRAVTNTWSFEFIKSGYTVSYWRIPGGRSFNLGTIRLR